MTTLKTAIKSILVLTMLLLGAYTVSHAQSHKIADQYWSQAEAAEKSSRYFEAARLCEKSAEAEKSSPNPRLYALSARLGQVGFCYWTIGQYDKALKHFEELLAIGRKLGQEGKVAYASTTSGRFTCQ